MIWACSYTTPRPYPPPKTSPPLAISGNTAKPYAFRVSSSSPGSSLFISLITVVARWSRTSRSPGVDGAVVQPITTAATNVRNRHVRVVARIDALRRGLVLDRFSVRLTFHVRGYHRGGTGSRTP